VNLNLLAWLIPDGFGRKFMPLIYAALIALLLSLVWALGSTGFGRAAGLYEVKYRAQMLSDAAYWAARALRGASEVGEVSSTARGYIEKGEGGYLLVYLYSGAGRVRQVVTLANVNNSTAALERFAQKYKGKQLQFDLFVLPTEKNPRALIWEMGKPLNLDVIEDGAGPDINPPTNIVDWIFARYYWHRAKSGPRA
jgi:hypothetical protein